MRVHQLLCGAGPVDAVTNQALAWRARFTAWGWEGGDFSDEASPDMDRRTVRPLKSFSREPGDAVLLHFSGYSPPIERVLEPPFMVLSHNVTPPRYFWALEPGEAVRCALAPGQLASIAQRAQMVAGVSRFNADELSAAGVEDVDVIPILHDRSHLPPPGPPPSGPPTVLFVGRLAPHKRQDLVIRAFALYRRKHAPDARLVLVGTPITPDFKRRLRGLADELAPGAVTIESGISTDALRERFTAAHAFLCLSEHEGFCIPLLEAFHFGVPVIARGVTAIPEVAGDAALLLREDDDLGVAAELLHLVSTDAELREELARRAQARLAEYDAERTAARMRERLLSLTS